jgi:hypothetical protein
MTTNTNGNLFETEERDADSEQERYDSFAV